MKLLTYVFLLGWIICLIQFFGEGIIFVLVIFIGLFLLLMLVAGMVSIHEKIKFKFFTKESIKHLFPNAPIYQKSVKEGKDINQAQKKRFDFFYRLHKNTLPSSRCFTIKGLNHRPLKSINAARHLKKGDILYLKAEPNNKFDKNAVSIYTPFNLKLGYLPAQSAKKMQSYILTGVPIECYFYSDKFINLYNFQIAVYIDNFAPSIHPLKCYPCDDLEERNEALTVNNFENKFLLDSLRANILSLAKKENEAIAKIKEMNTFEFMHYINSLGVYSSFKCSCDSCRWISHTIDSCYPINFDLLQITYTAIDKFNIKRSRLVLVGGILPANQLYLNAKEAHSKFLYTEALQMYSDIIHDIAHVNVYYDCLKYFQKYFLSIKEYEHYIDLCDYVLNTITLQYKGLEDQFDLYRLTSFAHECKDKVEPLLLKELSKSITKRISETKASITRLNSFLNKTNASTSEKSIYFSSWKLEQMEKRLEKLLEEKSAENLE